MRPAAFGITSRFATRIVVLALAAIQSPPSSPAPQSAHALVYDQSLQRVVLVTGHEGGARPESSEVWTFDGRRWERLEQPAPPSRFLSSAAYDTRRRRLVLMGGRIGKNSTPAADTWEWDGRAWREIADPIVGVREHHSMTFDERRGRVVMFGGTMRHAATPEWPDHVSEWDGARWHRVNAAGPGARNGTAIAYDAARGNVVLFGGVGADSKYTPGTWTWNGVTWTQMPGETPPLRATHQMTFDSDRGVVLLYGGGYTDGVRAVRRADFWQWDGTRWTEIKVSGPSPGPRVGHAMAYDRGRQRLVLFGGFSEGSPRFGDTWEWDGTRWTQIK